MRPVENDRSHLEWYGCISGSVALFAALRDLPHARQDLQEIPLFQQALQFLHFRLLAAAHDEELLPHVVLPDDHPFVGGQFAQAHRATRVQALGRDGHLGAQPELVAVREARAGIDIHRG